jgi:hypothetical protein
MNKIQQGMSEARNGGKNVSQGTSHTTCTNTQFDSIYLSYRDMQRKDTANLQFVTRRYFYRFNIDIYFGEKSFADIQYARVLGVNPG